MVRYCMRRVGGEGASVEDGVAEVGSYLILGRDRERVNWSRVLLQFV